MKRIQIFKAGTHKTVSGQDYTFSRANLIATAAAYDPSRYTAPLVLGHPLMDSPAYGRVTGLQVAGDALFAEVQPSPDLEQKVRDGNYISVSAMFYKPDQAGNPSPGVWALKHVGFLGANPPAVKGMQAPAFAESAMVAFAQNLSLNDLLSLGSTAPNTQPVCYAEDPHAFHAAALRMVATTGVSYAKACATLNDASRFEPQDMQTDRVGDHTRIVAFMEANPCATYGQAFSTLLAKGELIGD